MPIRGGDVLVSDGPFAETKKQIACFDLIECASMAEAVEVVSRHPATRIGTLELRQIRDRRPGTAMMSAAVVPRTGYVESTPR